MMQPAEDNKTAEKQIEDHHGAQCWVAGWGHTFYAGPRLENRSYRFLDFDSCLFNFKFTY